MLPKLIDQFVDKLTAECGYTVTHDDARSHIHQVVADVCRVISLKHAFGYHDPDDIYQTAYEEALKVLQKDVYDPGKKPLNNFLYVHIHNRLSNLKRKQYFRSEAPCKCCDAFNPGPDPCRRWREWARRNESKQRLMKPLTLAGDANIPAVQEDVHDLFVMEELRTYILERLSPEWHADFATFAEEGVLPRDRLNRLRALLVKILEDSPYA
jgi:DNA-directed RNA polymerase specialized sigma24 family protein